MGNTDVYVQNLHIHEITHGITRNADLNDDTLTGAQPGNRAEGLETQTEWFGFKTKPTVSLNLVALFSMNKATTKFLKKDFTFTVRDSDRKIVAKKTIGYCQESDYVYDRWKKSGLECVTYNWEPRIVFPTIKLKKPGVYQYTIAQDSITGDGFICDNNVHPVKVTLKDMKSAPIVEFPGGTPMFTNQQLD